jgi:DNA-binding transcriptional ArsR family regulator
MALRLHFDADAVLATRFAPSPAPLLELGLALATFRRRDELFAAWRARLALPREARPVLALVPPNGAGPTFIDPVISDLDEALETVATAPAHVVHSELRRVFSGGQVMPWVRNLDRRDTEAWQVLAASLVAAHRAVIGPASARLEAGHRAEVAVRAHTAAHCGMRAMLASVVPGSTWRGAVLSVPSAGDHDLVLRGRGVTLVPSAFWRGRPLHCDHPDGSVALVYPSTVPLPVVAPEAPANEPLAALLGATRAAILVAARGGRSTSELGRDLGISAASASEHAKVLRAAGLVGSVRSGRSVRHTTTPLGEHLVAGVAHPEAAGGS